MVQVIVLFQYTTIKFEDIASDYLMTAVKSFLKKFKKKKQEKSGNNAFCCLSNWSLIDSTTQQALDDCHYCQFHFT